MPVAHSFDPDRAAIWSERRKTLGARVRALRLERGLTQEALALEAGISRNMLITLEWGQRSVLADRLGDIAEVLGVTASDLLDDQKSGD